MTTSPAKPYAESCDQNKDAILAVLRQVFADRSRVLEIGSGTGQHAVHFGTHLPHLTWQTSEVAANHAGIHAWLDDARPENVLAPALLDVNQPQWPIDKADAIFSANTVHIMAWPEVEKMFQGIGRVLAENGLVALYGPFNYNGTFTSPSNAAFDAWLKGRDPNSGIRDFEALNELAGTQGMVLERDYPMPANNHTLVWRLRSD